MADVSNRHRKTLERIFEIPTLSSIDWSDIESLFSHLDAEIDEGKGSRIRVALNGAKSVFHRPHPQKETDRGAVEAVRDFLTKAGITP